MNLFFSKSFCVIRFYYTLLYLIINSVKISYFCPFLTKCFFLIQCDVTPIMSDLSLLVMVNFLFVFCYKWDEIKDNVNEDGNVCCLVREISLNIHCLKIICVIVNDPQAFCVAPLSQYSFLSTLREVVWENWISSLVPRPLRHRCPLTTARKGNH